MPKLIRRDTRQEYVLAEGVTHLGRLPTSTIQVLGKMVSRSHCHIEGPANGWVLADSGSKLGTFVNGELLMQPRRLQTADEIRVGSVFFIFDEGRPGHPADVKRLSDDVAAQFVPFPTIESPSRALAYVAGGLLAALAVGGLLAVLLLTRETPSRVVRQAAGLLRQRAAGKLWDLVSAERRQALSFEAFEESVQALPDAVLAALATLETGRPRRDERGVVVPVTLRVGDRRLAGEIVLFREDGQWKIHSVPTGRLAELNP